MKKKWLILLSTIVLITLFTFSSRFISGITSPVWRYLIKIILYALLFIISFFAMKMSGLPVKEAFLSKGGKQYIIALMIFSVLFLSFVILPILFGGNLIVSHIDYKLKDFILNFIFIVLFVGPVEEFVFRVYIMDALKELFPKIPWISIIISSLLFGLWHLINGSWIQVLFTSIIGGIIGVFKYFVKGTTFKSIGLAHGVYDFAIYLVRVFIIH